MSEAEAHLITEVEGEASRGPASIGGSRSGFGDGGWRSAKRYQRRSDALAYGDRYQKAAALVDLVGSLSLLCSCSASLTALHR
ncbi:hypothetical protein PR202_ga10142 [Eleusine coracana subsp. coracana]|uniref:Uncharacterized protein n=1 Tax=Eleusine coracana subsp. coracana TaxID=191504 RepID=A0AAV5C5Z0_ELECO|nr:hypothetical protein PR202_ga10142 [Eleusine coracana subsp. coracana]